MKFKNVAASARAGSFVLEFSRITPHGGVLTEGCIANILILLFTWGNKSSFDGYNCPVQKIKVTEGGPILTCKSLVMKRVCSYKSIPAVVKARGLGYRSIDFD